MPRASLLLESLTTIWLLTPSALATEAAPVGTVPFILDDNRVFAELMFMRPDGTLRRTVAFVDLGTPALELSDGLYRELRLDQKAPLVLRVGHLELHANADLAQIDSGSWMTGPNGKRTIPVEAVLPGSLLTSYQVVFDYGQRTLTIALPGTLKPSGLGVPCRVNETSGLISVDASIDRHSYAVAVDSGSAYTWFSKSISLQWLKHHPTWQHGTGAVGESNMQTRADGAEAAAFVLRLPEINLGALHLEQIGALAIAPLAPPFPPIPGTEPVRGDFFAWYSNKAPEPVIGWVGGNVLKAFRVMIDYPKHMTYWEQETDLDPHDLDQVGLTLETRDGTKGYFVAAIASKGGKPTVEGVRAGDRLLRVNGVALQNLTQGAIFSLLHGEPGAVRTVAVEREGRQLRFVVPVTAF